MPSGQHRLLTENIQTIVRGKESELVVLQMNGTFIDELLFYHQPSETLFGLSDLCYYSFNFFHRVFVLIQIINLKFSFFSTLSSIS